MTRLLFVLMLVLSVLSTQAYAGKETAYDRVMQTRTLRCAYGIWEPAVMRNPNTGEMSGIFVDMMEYLGKSLNIKIEWAQEIDWGQIPTALQSNKYDAHCAGMWSSPKRGTRIAFSDPIFYTSTVTAVRADDTRFDESLDIANSPDIIIATGDDDVSEEIAMQDFPLAQRVAKSPLAGDEQLMMMVINGKADLTFNEPNYIRSFMEYNPGKIKIIHEDNPIRVYGNTIGFNIHEGALVRVFNTAIRNFVDSGGMDRLFKKYEDRYDISHYVRVKKSY